MLPPLYAPLTSEIKAVALSCLSVWPEQSDRIQRASILVAQQSLYWFDLTLRCQSQDKATSYELVSVWNPTSRNAYNRRPPARTYIGCDCPDWRQHTDRNFDHLSSRQCKHTIAYLMYRRIVEDTITRLHYPPIPCVEYHRTPGAKHATLTQRQLHYASMYLAEIVAGRPEEWQPQTEWQPSLTPSQYATWFDTGCVV